jgi:hypothetical protein
LKTTIGLAGMIAAAALWTAPVAGVATLGLAMSAAPAAAQDACDDLWYRRNEIYARNGFCFKTARARAAFGDGCFPPYGRLSPREKAIVSRIEQREMEYGCR